MADEQPILIIKKKGGHGGHHGGAWKVAYADFVTAMMSLFIVLWLMSSTPKPVQEEIAGYFNDPKGTASKKGSEGKPISKEIKESKEAKNNKDMDELKNQLLRAIEDVNLLNKLKKQIEITLTDEGLRIELIEDEKGTFFESGSAQPTPALQQILKVLSDRLKGLPNKMSIEGHTDAQPYMKQTAYGNWELSTDRANVARRQMQEDGIRANQVSQVRGFADQQLHIPERPFDAANRRVSLVVQNLSMTGKPVDAAKGAGTQGKGPAKAEHEKVREGKSASPTAEDKTRSLAAAEGRDMAPAVEWKAGEEKTAALAGQTGSSAVGQIAKPSVGLVDRVKGMFDKKK